MENTLQNKAKFFATYYGQEVLISSTPTLEGFRMKKRLMSYLNSVTHVEYLELKPLSQISDEDAIEARNIVKNTMFFDDKLPNDMIDILTLKKGINRMFDEPTGCWLTIVNMSFMIDHLRFKGYALPFMCLSVEQLQEYGWVKLTTV